MRNLKLRYTTTHNTNAVDAKFIALDPSGTNKNTIFICTDKELLSYNFADKKATVLAEVCDVVSFEYLSLENEICVATGAGEVLLINPGTKTLNEVTYCDGGIEKMVWSPDQEVVAFVTKARHVVVMTCTFEPISEVILDESTTGQHEFVSVGWGKKETQFHGSEGKAAAKEQVVVQNEENFADLPQEVDITWRADGAFFAVTFVDSGRRMFNVFDKEGTLKYKSEKNLKDLSPAIAWRPSGTWIAVPHKFPNKSTIGLFEKNGLRHREIVLPFSFDNEPVVSLKWSADSDILSVETVVQGKTNLYLYTIGNYHWYIKQTLCFDTVLATCVWDNRIGEEKTLYAMLPDGTLAKYSWTYKIDRYQASVENQKAPANSNKSALVAVIDGKRLLITDFRKCIIPPPMSSYVLECDSYINSCAFLTSSTTADEGTSPVYECSIVICNAKNELLQYTLSAANKYTLDRTIPLEQSAVPLSHNNFLWPTDSKLYWVQSIGQKSKLWLYQLREEIPLSTVETDETICCLEGADALHVIAHKINGKISEISYLNNGKVDTINENYCDPGQLCDQIEYFKRNNLSGVISLDIHQGLRSNSKTISTDVTSFHITTNYVVFTQLAVMKFLRLSDGKIVNERKIERGAKLVTILPHDSTTILQLPRGNLEVIHPRVLCLELVGDLLDNSDYRSAMDLVRKQRINLNIICDHNMGKFLENLKEFLLQTKPQWLNLFLTDLLNEDFTTTMYASNYPDTERKYPEEFRVENKIAHICQQLCNLMEVESFNKFLLPIITASVKIGNIEKALDIIWQEKKKESAATADGTSMADDALKYLLYLVDVNQLYDVALGMYDFGLVLMVAKKSQKDPREFLPFLNELKALEENYRKFKIDFHLKRFDKALVNISRCGGDRFEEALDLTKSHNLFKVALSAYKGNSTCYKKIAHAYGDYLRENGKFENASIMYERAEDRIQAVACARHVLDWQRCLSLTKKEGAYPQDVAMSLVPSLMEHGRYEDAYELLKRYGNSFTEGIACLLKGNLYLRAVFEVRMENSELLETLIHPHLLSYKETLESNLNTDREHFLKQKMRLLAIREKKSKEVDDMDDSVQIDEIDLLSDTTSMHSSRYTSSSRGTGKTFRSSKNRRKHERKLLSLKEGNPFEDIALIDALHTHIMKVYGLQMHIRDTCKALLEIFEDDHARSIQRQYKSLLIFIRESLDEIWIPEIMTTAQYVTGPNVDYAALQNEQRYAMINPLKRFKPQLNLQDWEHEILK